MLGGNEDRRRLGGRLRGGTRRSARPCGRVGLGKDDGRSRSARLCEDEACTSLAARSSSTARTSSDLASGSCRHCAGGRVAYVPQEPSAALNPVRRVGKQIAEILRVHEGRRLQATPTWPGASARCSPRSTCRPTPAFLRRFPHQLSGGQQQRVVIAMAFACRPGVIVFRRADNRARRHHTAALPRVDRRSVRDERGRRGVRVPRPRRRRSGGKDGGGHVRGPHRRARTDRHGVRDAECTLTRACSCGLCLRSTRPEVMEGIEGQPPRPASRPAGMLVRTTVPRRRTGVPRRSRRRWWRSPNAPGPLRRDSTGRRATSRTAGLSCSEDRAASAPAVLEVEGLRASFGTNEVLHDVGFALPEDTCVAVVGESGSGKTTLARCIIGMHTNWQGSIRYKGEAACPRCSPAQQGNVLKRIQYVFQDPYTALEPAQDRRSARRPAHRPLLRAGTRRGGRPGRQGARGGVTLRRFPEPLPRPALGRRAPACRDRPGAWPPSRNCSCATRCPPPSTSRCRRRSSSCCDVYRQSIGWRCSSSPTTWRLCAGSPSRSSCSQAGPGR